MFQNVGTLGKQIKVPTFPQNFLKLPLQPSPQTLFFLGSWAAFQKPSVAYVLDNYIYSLSAAKEYRLLMVVSKHLWTN